MALLNPPELLPSVARYIYRYLLAQPGRSAPKAQIIAALAPPTLLHPTESGASPGSPEVERTLALCVSLGLVASDRDEVTLSPDLPDFALDPRRGDASFVTLLRGLVLAAEQNHADWGSQEGTRDFTNALAWYLTLDPSEFPGTWSACGNRPGAADRQAKEFGGVGPIVNDQRWKPFARWSGYLGFTWSGAFDHGAVVVPDPTVAVRDSIATILELGEEVRATEFVDRLAGELPVLDRGAYWRFVEDARGRAGSKRTDSLSASTSMALVRLEGEGALQLIDRADTDKLSLAPTTGSSRTISHVARPKAHNRKQVGR